jgi:hypothetical protein
MCRLNFFDKNLLLTNEMRTTIELTCLYVMSLETCGVTLFINETNMLSPWLVVLLLSSWIVGSKSHYHFQMCYNILSFLMLQMTFHSNFLIMVVYGTNQNFIVKTNILQLIFHYMKLFFWVPYNDVNGTTFTCKCLNMFYT